MRSSSGGNNQINKFNFALDERTLHKSSNADDDFNSVSERCIQQTGERLAKFCGHLFGSFAKQLGRC